MSIYGLAAPPILFSGLTFWHQSEGKYEETWCYLVKLWWISPQLGKRPKDIAIFLAHFMISEGPLHLNFRICSRC
ncbi:hypothetical protein A0H81_01714 [Grifola frondosa]|uniref:Uncharacterized protein n=1 Tax=Grifola frondosa TaxID=5627 RepID=A0A1C7MMS5_GRIFR|nr:hypothetical protein A0H81_01714 [Grifola frondosa]